MKRKKLTKPTYNQLVDNIAGILSAARSQAVRQVNQILVKTYWEIGKEIVEYEQKGQERAEYKSQLIANLSRELTETHGKGFTKTNLYNMVLFYKNYKIFQTVSGKLSWSHYCLLLAVSDPNARAFYKKNTIAVKPQDELSQTISILRLKGKQK